MFIVVEARREEDVAGGLVVGVGVDEEVIRVEGAARNAGGDRVDERGRRRVVGVAATAAMSSSGMAWW